LCWWASECRRKALTADFALRHNVPGGYVEVVTGTRNSHAVLSVINTGPVVPAAAVDRLLRPFQRL
jgi:signal transduction histidine kinase